MRDLFFSVAYWLIRLSPLYVIIGLLLGLKGVPGNLILLPIPLIFTPAVAFIMLTRCRNCKNFIYTPQIMRKAREQGHVAFRPFIICPVCNNRL